MHLKKVSGKLKAEVFFDQIQKTADQKLITDIEDYFSNDTKVEQLLKIEYCTNCSSNYTYETE